MTRRIEISYAPNTSVVDVMADVDITVPESYGPADISDLLSTGVLRSCADRAQFTPGKYNIRLLAVITREDDGTSESKD